MKYEWILDVLADLKVFAQANGLNSLADQLEQARKAAAVEVVSGPAITGSVALGDDTAKRTYSRNTGASART